MAKARGFQCVTLVKAQPRAIGMGNGFPSRTVNNHIRQHPLNNVVAYELDTLLGFGVVPQTEFVAHRDNKDFKARFLGFSDFVDDSDNEYEILDEEVIIIQRGAKRAYDPPEKGLDEESIVDERAFIYSLELNEPSAHKAQLFNMIFRAKDNDLYRMENTIITESGEVVLFDLDIAGIPINEQYEELQDTRVNNGTENVPFEKKDWLLFHPSAKQPISEELKGMILAANPKQVKQALEHKLQQMGVEEPSEQVLEGIEANLTQVQQAIREIESKNNPLSPWGIFCTAYNNC